MPRDGFLGEDLKAVRLAASEISRTHGSPFAAGAYSQADDKSDDSSVQAGQPLDDSYDPGGTARIRHVHKPPEHNDSIPTWSHLLLNPCILHTTAAV